MICKKCSKKFEVWVRINGKLRNLCNRKYCLECSPFGKHNVRKIHIVFDKMAICIFCKKSYNNENRKRKNVCGSCFVSNTRRKIKKTLVEIYGGCCTICGYKNCIEALEFHHLDPSQKEKTISWGSRSLRKQLEETKKCILVCCRCHREIHAQQRLSNGPVV